MTTTTTTMATTTMATRRGGRRGVQTRAVQAPPTTRVPPRKPEGAKDWSRREGLIDVILSIHSFPPAGTSGDASEGSRDARARGDVYGRDD